MEHLTSITTGTHHKVDSHIPCVFLRHLGQLQLPLDLRPVGCRQQGLQLDCLTNGRKHSMSGPGLGSIWPIFLRPTHCLLQDAVKLASFGALDRDLRNWASHPPALSERVAHRYVLVKIHSSRSNYYCVRRQVSTDLLEQLHEDRAWTLFSFRSQSSCSKWLMSRSICPKILSHQLCTRSYDRAVVS